MDARRHWFWILFLSLFLAACSSNSPKKAYDNMSAEQIFMKGRKNLKRQQYAHAIEDFDALEARYPYGDYTEKAQLGAIYAYFEGQEPESALAASERFIQLHPRHEHVDYAYYMKGLVKFSESLVSFDRYLPLDPAERDITGSQESFYHFDELLRRFPKSRYAPDARQRMIFLKNIMARHELEVAEHYLKREAPIAALNRAIDVVEQFDNTPSNKDALRVMATSYRTLGLKQLAEDTERVLELQTK